MKSRGRHRRQKRGRALRAFLAGTALALTAAATMISASQATVSEDPGGLKALDTAGTSRFPLQEHLVPRAALDRLASAMGRPVGVRSVLADTDRSLRTPADCTTADRSALPVEPAATRAYCWDAADTRGWRAGAVTTSGDADDDGHWGDDRVILSGWSHDTGRAGRPGPARVAFVNADDPDHLTYTWALLAVPTDGGRNYTGLASTVSGLVWYQDKLLVTTAEGLYVYDLRRVQRASVDSDRVGRVHGGWSAYGARYVLPAVGSYALGRGTPRPAAVSLDRSTAPDSLVASEAVPANSDRPTRLWRYRFSSDPARAGLLATDSEGRAVASEAYETKTTGIAGVLSYGSDWYLDRPSDSRDDRGTLWRQNRQDAKATECGSDDSHHCWGGRAGSLSFWEETGEVWSQSGRMLYALPLSSIDRSLAE
ncbi:hypothetical protein [Streptomyces griseorubiginosus]|uniref:hypothetical protein n=1 Tax=Streptomyces griseorubiginosus TaxID=67304 RepID=UPI001AD7D020|nr:hypothetical protein [Streptomyces griseorubiginosus]MBO4254880.1 hypothetical protein [Streptomyces griseorubiginosus]